jgi:ferredoxin
MNLLKLVDQLAAETDWDIYFDPSACQHSLDRFSTCEACYNVCPVGAITPGKPPAFDPAACHHCHACIATCPFGAYTYSGIDPIQALIKLLDQQKVATCELFCQLNPNLDASCTGSEAGIRVRGCLAGLGTGGYLAVLSQGVNKVFVRTDACEGCPWGGLIGQIEQQIAEARQWLAIWGRADDLMLAEPDPTEAQRQRPVWNAESPPRSRTGRDSGPAFIP